MDIHNQFTSMYFLLIFTIFVAVNLVILRFKKQNWKVLFDWKVIATAFVITLLGLLYCESSKSNDWLIETSGFPKYFYLKKSSLGKDALMDWGIVQFDYINFLQNLILIFLLLDIFKLMLQNSLKTKTTNLK
jgi:amino acid transporter